MLGSSPVLAADQGWALLSRCDSDSILKAGTDVELVAKEPLVQKRFRVAGRYEADGYTFDVTGCDKENFHTTLRAGDESNDAAFYAVPIFDRTQYDFLAIVGDEETKDYIVYSAKQRYSEVFRFLSYDSAQAEYSKDSGVYVFFVSNIRYFICGNGAKPSIGLLQPQAQRVDPRTVCVKTR